MAAIVNLKGRKPQQLLPGEIYCGRPIHMGGWNLAGSKWANPFKVGTNCQDLDQCILYYMTHIMSTPELFAALPELRGKTLACWCKPNRCHCDILVHLLQTYHPV